MLEKAVKHWCRKSGGAFDLFFPGHLRVSPRGGPFAAAGVADDLLCWRGVFIAIEVKRATGQPTALQLDFLRQVNAAGGVGAVLRGPDVVRMRAILDRATSILQQRGTVGGPSSEC